MPNICSLCGKTFEYSLSVSNGVCVHDSPATGSKKKDLGNLRKENARATAEAQRMAGEARRNEAVNNPEVTLAPIPGASKFGQNVTVKKSILDSLAAKAPKE